LVQPLPVVCPDFFYLDDLTNTCVAVPPTGDFTPVVVCDDGYYLVEDTNTCVKLPEP